MPSRSLRWIAGGALAAIASVGACGYPDFTYGSGSGGDSAGSTTSSTTSTGGFGGTSSSRTSTATGGSTSTGRTTTTTGGGGSGGSVSLTVGCFDKESQCPHGEICCYDQQDAQRDCDECAPTADDCGADLSDCDPPQSYVRLTCDQDADCAGNGQVCCVHVMDDGEENLVTGISCSNSCNMTTTFPVCSPKQTCASGDCNDLKFAGYGYCQ